jgi:hypothetical protein
MARGLEMSAQVRMRRSVGRLGVNTLPVPEQLVEMCEVGASFGRAGLPQRFLCWYGLLSVIR